MERRALCGFVSSYSEPVIGWPLQINLHLTTREVLNFWRSFVNLGRSPSTPRPDRQTDQGLRGTRVVRGFVSSCSELVIRLLLSIFI